MKSTSKALGLLLLTVVTAGAIAAEALPAMPAPHQQLAGCHEHGPMKSLPAPLSSPDYACCQTGHHTALPREPFATRFSGAQVAPVVESTLPAITAFLSSHIELHPLPFSSPPSLSPLRI